MSGELPTGACDSHCHVFGPAAQFPFDPQRTYTPADAPIQQLLDLHGQLGIDRAVVVQPACHGFDNEVTLDAIRASGHRYRGVALVPQSIEPSEIARLDRAGMRGVRFNFVPHLSAPPTVSNFRSIVDRIAPFGWHVLLHVSAGDLDGLGDYLDDLPVPVVIDHMGRIGTSGGLHSRSFERLLAFARNPNIWVKISGGDRVSEEGPPWRDAVPFARHLVEVAPERILWGTDWPHPNVKGPVPDDRALVDLLADMVPDADRRRRILVDNPDLLYRFSTRAVGA